MKRYNYNSMKIIVFLAVIAVSCSVAFAQNPSDNSLRPRIGLFGNIDFNLHSGGFSQLPSVSNCCPEFSSASDLGWLVGVSYIDPISEDFGIHIRMHYWQYGATFQETETQPIVDLQGGPSQATIQHELTGSFSQISLEPLLAFKLSPDFSLLGGLTLGYIFSATYDQKETLLEPTDGLFANNSRIRNASSGDIPDASALGIGITIGASFDLPLNSDKTVLLSPEILATISPMDLVSGVSWKAQHIRAGFALTFIPPEIEDTMSDIELYEFARTLTPPTKSTPGIAFTSSLAVSTIGSDGRALPTKSIRIEEFASNRIRPLLPYVFFEEGSADVDSRYRSLNGDQADRFSMENFYNLDAMMTYYHLLNIIGRRMTDDASSSITITGCTDESESAYGSSLGQRRAEAVANYLKGTWGISGSRITLASRGNPETPSNAATPDGRAENRRVEITTTSSSILAPVESKDTLRASDPPGLRLQPSIDPRVPIASWTVFVSSEDRLIKTYHGTDPIPASIDWNIGERMAFIPRNSTELQAMLAVRDSNGAVIPSSTQTIAVSQVTLEDKSRSGGTDKTIDKYSLILFGYDKSDLTQDHQNMINEVKKRITPGSTVSVLGYTDRSGADDYNLRLSDQRAKSVARALGVPESNARGMGEALPLYDNDLPEGRFYSRTVEVVVETPKR